MLINFDEKFLFVGGGLSGKYPNYECLKSVEMFTIADNSWKTIREMNLGRNESSSCTLNDFIYVFCGIHSY